MAQLYLAANLINPIAVTGAAHLQFVYGNVGSLLELEVQADDNSIFGDPWVYKGVRDHGGTELTDETVLDPTTSINFEDVITNPERYVRIVLPLREEQTAAYVWELLEKINDALQAALDDLVPTIADA